LSTAVPRPLPKLPAQFAALPFQQLPMREAPEVQTHVIASNRHARAAIVIAARAAGHAAEDHGPLPVSDAAACGDTLAKELLALPRGIHVWGGETTVKLPEHPGQGGRNQHLALSAARILAGRQGVLILSGASDGSDGNDDAGAIVDGGTFERGRDAGYDASACLVRAAAGDFLEGSGDLLHTGPTGTNVMDLVIGYKTEA
jgi:glycerate 2-kinase